MKFFVNISKIYKYSYGCRKYIFLYFVVSIIVTLVGIVIPVVTSLQLVNLTGGLWDKVVIYSLCLFGLKIFSDFLNLIIGFASQKFSKIVVNKIQLEVGREILKLSLTDIDKHSNGVFIQRLTRDASDISYIFTFGVNSFIGIINGLGVIIIVFLINKWVGLFFIVYLVIGMIIQRIKIRKIDKKDKEFRDQRERTSGFTTELIRGIRDIKMLNAEDSFMKKAEENISELTKRNYDMSYLYRVFSFVSSGIDSLFDLILVIIIVWFVSYNYFDIAIGIVIYNYRSYIMSLVYDISSILDDVREFNMSCERVFSLFGSDEFKKEKFGSVHLNNVRGDFEFRNVVFSYDKKIVLDNISFKVKANETVGFVGKSGAGKSTIFNLLCKFYDLNSGCIMIDGIDIKRLDKDSIRGNITVISQSPYIFNMSIRDNLKLVKDDLTEEEMISACKASCLDDFINELPDKYDTIIGEGGVNLSGGQRQRLAIARALVQKTEIILFDEATSALDNETQTKIQRSIENMKNEYTILIIAHRLSTIINCDRILFIDGGRVIAEGNHEYLLENNKDYKELYESENIEK